MVWHAGQLPDHRPATRVGAIALAILVAFDFPLRAIRTYWLSLLTLAVVAVLVTTATVAWAGVALAGLPLAAAVVLGAIVSPPDAAAAAAMLSRPDLPRATVTVLKGESLLNDAVALLIFGVGPGGSPPTADRVCRHCRKLHSPIPGDCCWES